MSLVIEKFGYIDLERTYRFCKKRYAAEKAAGNAVGAAFYEGKIEALDRVLSSIMSGQVKDGGRDDI